MNFEWFQMPLLYIGPGAGMGLLLSLVGLVVAVGGALFTVLLWPIRKMLKKNKVAGPSE